MNFQIDVQCMHTFRVGEIGMEPQLLASAIRNQSPPNLIDAINYSTDTGNFINEAISTDRRYPVDICIRAISNVGIGILKYIRVNTSTGVLECSRMPMEMGLISAPPRMQDARSCIKVRGISSREDRSRVHSFQFLEIVLQHVCDRSLH